MAVDNETLQLFFKNQKKPRIDALACSIKPIPNQYQTNTKVVPNQYQTNTKSDTKSTSNRHQTNTKSNFFSLTGLQKKITIIIYKLCQLARNKNTEAVSISQLSNQCHSTVGSIKTAIHRLINKGFLIRETFKNGRAGWTTYSIPNYIYQEMLSLDTQHKLVSNQYQTDTKVVSEVIPTTNSSSSNINTTTNNDHVSVNNLQLNLPNQWQNLDIEPLALVGFTITHLYQIASQGKLQPQAVQDSIYAFAFDLQENNKAKTIKGDPLNFFMGILRNGRVYTFPSNYESPQDKAMRIYHEQLQELSQKRESLEKETKNLAFQDWFSNLTDEQKKEFLPKTFRNNAHIENNKILEGGARDHFEREIWPNKKSEIAKRGGTTETKE